MLKSILQYIIVFTILFIVGKYTHFFILNNDITFPLGEVYLYHYVFSLCICCLFTYLVHEDILKEQLGLIYLATLFLKIIFFTILFKSTMFGDTPIAQQDRVSMLVPMGIFLFTEVFFISKILRRI
ncbi:hypothetical protein KO500_05845 [Cellulophaga baltica]|uniref:DUF6168 family protein n=1 Tax=Cellulophaga TaxID=104264 RepID=UPI001C078637|nr:MULTISPECIES: DUF6168 family protein [Cellulophaga]MBU2995944.1 hypothetical protein [Cellulophaga baltica]MDO6767339.1 DUF6168 family protein [Cellulophaga sp. 1_MG-2023]